MFGVKLDMAIGTKLTGQNLPAAEFNLALVLRSIATSGTSHRLADLTREPIRAILFASGPGQISLAKPEKYRLGTGC